MNKKQLNFLSVIVKLAMTLLVISPFYIALIYSVKSKQEMVTDRLAFQKPSTGTILPEPLKLQILAWH